MMMTRNGGKTTTTFAKGKPLLKAFFWTIEMFLDSLTLAGCFFPLFVPRKHSIFQVEQHFPAYTFFLLIILCSYLVDRSVYVCFFLLYFSSCCLNIIRKIYFNIDMRHTDTQTHRRRRCCCCCIKRKIMNIMEMDECKVNSISAFYPKARNENTQRNDF